MGTFNLIPLFRNMTIRLSTLMQLLNSEADSTREQQWTDWPVTHHGPVIDYLANCNGQCDTADKTSLMFNKIDAVGLLGESTGPGSAGFWGSDKLREANNTWTVTIPSTIAKGEYVLRHEIIALHEARAGGGGAQNYPHCINLEVTGSGTDLLTSGTLGTKLYRRTDPGIQVDIYKPIKYQMPGPPLYRGGSSESSGTMANSGLGGGLNNLGIGGELSDSISAASQAGGVATSAAANAVSTSHVAAMTPLPTSSPPWSNFTGANMTLPKLSTPMTSFPAVSTSSAAIYAISSAGTFVNSPSNGIESVQMGTPAVSTPSYPSSTDQPAATTSVPEIPVESTGPEAAVTSSMVAAPTTQPNTQTLPVNPDQSMFSAMSFSQLLQYLKAIVAELSSKSDAGQTMRRRHARDVKSS